MLQMHNLPARPMRFGRDAPTGMRPHQLGRASALASQREFKTHSVPHPKKDKTADFMELAIKEAVKLRLRQHEKIKAEVQCNGWGLLGGKFDSMNIQGQGWRTPLELTARRIEVALGEMCVDYGALLRLHVTLKNKPLGTTRIVLNAVDLGNFMVHPIMKAATSKAVEGYAFAFDRHDVHIEDSGKGTVVYQGTWAKDGQRYRIHMTPLVQTHQPGSRAKQQLDMRAEWLGSSVPGKELPANYRAAAAKQVANGVQDFFTNLNIDLQGIELKNPTMFVYPCTSKSEHLLEINMDMRIRQLPPLGMQF